MATELFADNAATTLTSSPIAGATSFTVTSSTGFPAASNAAVPPTQFRSIIGTEIVTVTNVSGTTWTCVALAAGHTSGDAVTHVVTAQTMGDAWAAGGGDLFPPGQYSHSLNSSAAATATNLALGVMLAVPFTAPVRRAFDRIGINVTAGGAAGCVLRMGIYTDAGGAPGVLIVDGGTVAATTTGAKEVVIAQTLVPGRCWLAVATQVAGTPSLTAYSNTLTVPGVGIGTAPPTATSSQVGYFVSSVTGALPSSPTWGPTSGIPMLCLRAT